MAKPSEINRELAKRRDAAIRRAGGGPKMPKGYKGPHRKGGGNDGMGGYQGGRRKEGCCSYQEAGRALARGKGALAWRYVRLDVKARLGII